MKRLAFILILTCSLAQADSWWSGHFSLAFSISYLGQLGATGAGCGLGIERQFGVPSLQVGLGVRADTSIDLQNKKLPAFVGDGYVHLTAFPLKKEWSPFLGVEAGIGAVKHADYELVSAGKTLGVRAGISVGKRDRDNKHFEIGVRGDVIVETYFPSTPWIAVWWIKIPF